MACFFMDKPLYLQREKKRKSVKVKSDIESTNNILREDIYDLIKAYFDAGKTREEAMTELRLFLKGIISKSIEYQGNRETGIERIISDIDSYGLDWSKNG